MPIGIYKHKPLSKKVKEKISNSMKGKMPNNINILIKNGIKFEKGHIFFDFKVKKYCFSVEIRFNLENEDAILKRIKEIYKKLGEEFKNE
ncbi:MAG: hypothetical protein ACP6IY_22560 [Promethearchaeia archaeon]